MLLARFPTSVATTEKPLPASPALAASIEALSSCKFCDRIVVLGAKRIQEMGSHDELMERNGLYAQMFNTQAGWYVGQN